MHLAVKYLRCVLLTGLVAGTGFGQGLSGFEFPAPLNTNAAVDSGGDRNPRVATDGRGAWIAVWRSKDSLGGTIGSDADILFALSLDAGATWSDPAPVNNNAGTDSGGDALPQVATDGLGTWIVVWYSRDRVDGTLGNDRDILFSRSTDLGATWTAPAPLHANASSDTGEDFEPHLATDGLGNWVAVWVSTNTFGGILATDEDIVVARSTDAGVTWSAPAPLNSNADRNTRTDDEPRLATNRLGTWITVWQSKEGSGDLDNDYDILFARSEDAGATWSESLPINSNADNDGGADWTPAIATDTQGLWITVWVRRNTELDPSKVDTDLWFSRSEDEGRTWSGRRRLHRNTRRDDWWPEIASDGQGTWAVVWYGRHKGDRDILVTRSASGGESWTKHDLLNANAGSDSGRDQFPDIATDANGNWLAVWESEDRLDKTIGRDGDVLFARGLLSQTDAQQKCTNALNKMAASLARGQEKQVMRCLGETFFQTCLAANPPRAKTVRRCDLVDEGGFSTTPAFGVAPPGTLHAAALEAPGLLALDLFGPDLDVAFPSDDPVGVACQREALKGSYGVYDVLWKELLTGKKSVLAGKVDGQHVSPPESADELAADLDAWLQADRKHKITSAVESLSDGVVKACETPQKPPVNSLDLLFPGLCTDAAAGGGNVLAGCASVRSHCRFCQQLNKSDSLSIDCDSFDDDTANGSCALVP